MGNWRAVTVSSWSGLPALHTCACCNCHQRKDAWKCSCSETGCAWCLLKKRVGRQNSLVVNLLRRVTCPLLFPLCSVPTPMLPTPTPDQAHRSHRAAWGIQLPPSSRPSTRTRPTGTELPPDDVSALLLTLQDRPHSCLLEPALGHQNVL